MHKVSINFFPLASNEFTIPVYCLPFTDVRPEFGEDEAIMRNLNVDSEYKPYWTFSKEVPKSFEFICQPFDNVYVTIDTLRKSLIQSCTDQLDSDQFKIVGNFRKSVEIVQQVHVQGSEVVILEPYFLRSKWIFGFLVDFRFHPNEDHRRTRKALQLSLSLDRHGQQNLSYYADRYTQFATYLDGLHKQIFPLKLPREQTLATESRLVAITPSILDMKKYVVGSEVESRSQFMGVKQSGPFRKIDKPQDTQLCFLYRQEDRTLSHDLYRALRGDTFRTFPGMQEMFNFPLSKDNVKGVALKNFSISEINRIRDEVSPYATSRRLVPIVLTPFSRHDQPEDNAHYWHLKHAFLSCGLPIQVVATETVSDKNILKWATASIGLQIFAKAGGTPWKVQPRIERCLIVGIGQAHRKIDEHFERYFAYSVLTNSSGEFKEVRVLGDERDESKYLEAFGANLGQIFKDYSSQFSNFVVHSTFAIRRNELDRISAALQEQKGQTDMGEFVSLKFNDRNRFFGFSANHNSRVPYESTVIALSHNEFLIWFEGLQFGDKTLRKMVGNPMHVKFTYPLEDLSDQQQRAHLQDAINLSGANWRGFNAKSLPVSVYYAQLIAKYLKEFESHRLPELDVNILTPWFL